MYRSIASCSRYKFLMIKGLYSRAHLTMESRSIRPDVYHLVSFGKFLKYCKVMLHIKGTRSWCSLCVRRQVLNNPINFNFAASVMVSSHSTTVQNAYRTTQGYDLLCSLPVTPSRAGPTKSTHQTLHCCGYCCAGR
jgi:hypothetical protein